MTDTQTVSLADIGNRFASLDPAFNHFHGKLFSYIPPEPERFGKMVTAMRLPRDAFPNRHPATLLVGRLASFITKQSQQVLATRDGQFTILIELNERKLPDYDYLAIISPTEKNGLTMNYSLAYESIQFLRSLIALSFGTLPFYTLIGDFDFNSDGQVSFHSQAVRMPLYADLLTIVDNDMMSEITARLALQQNDFRQRLQSATSFFETAMRHEDGAFRFASYWIALEIIVGGKADAIRSRLSSAYGQTDKKFADNHLLFGEIAKMRNNLIHRGEFHKLRSYQERLMQLYFWDIVIHQIGLKSKQLSMMLIGSGVVEQEKTAYGPH
jgi:hypothetical protein